MISKSMAAPKRRALVVGSMALAGSLLAVSRDAHACGATPTEVQALLPLEGATNVPLNAVLISSSNLTAAVFELHEVLDADAGARALAPPLDAGTNPAGDAGAPGAVPLDVDCSALGQGGGAVCLARPLQALEPNTRYAWRTNVVVPDGYVPGYFQGLSREFTTGSASDEQAIDADAVSLAVIANHRNTTAGGNDCGIDHWLEVAYTLRASESAVLHFADYTPSYVMHATLLSGALSGALTAGAGATTTATLYSPPGCLAPVVYDVAGHRTALPEWCPGDGAVQSPATDVAENDGEFYPRNPGSGSNSGTGASPNPKAPTVASRDRSLCTLSMPPTSTSRALPMAAGFGLALLLAGRRRRRS